MAVRLCILGGLTAILVVTVMMVVVRGGEAGNADDIGDEGYTDSQ